MGSRLNFVDCVSDEVMNQKQTTFGSNVLVPLTRQNSIFSLTFDEFQNSWGKDFGSMNMDELLKSIWSAEETQSTISNNNNNGGGGCSSVVGLGGESFGFYNGGSLQRQGSLSLPRTISQKKVDDVWKELMKEDDNGGNVIPQRQQTLGEMTLEEFLARAGVVREESQPVEKLDNFNGGEFYGFGSNGFSPNPQPLQMQQPHKVNQPRQLIKKPEIPFTKETTITFGNTIDVDNRSQPLTECQEVKPSILGIRDHTMNNNLLQAVDFKTGVTVQMSPDLTPKSAVEASLSPAPYMFGRVRKTGAVLEKVIERRQKRMIKNRESAARSRARKQAYTLELEAEIAQLKVLNEELQKKQVEIIEKQKNQLLEPMRQPYGCKRQCLRRTTTGPW